MLSSNTNRCVQSFIEKILFDPWGELSKRNKLFVSHRSLDKRHGTIRPLSAKHLNESRNYPGINNVIRKRETNEAHSGGPEGFESFSSTGISVCEASFTHRSNGIGEVRGFVRGKLRKRLKQFSRLWGALRREGLKVLGLLTNFLSAG
jgi:hypothetical protein